MSYFIFDGKKVFYSVQGSGENLLLLHGNSVSSVMFRKDIKFFSNYFRVITIDYPGHGKSERIDLFRDDFWLYNSKAAIQLLHNLKIEKVRIIGTSGGAVVGLNLVNESPNLCHKLIADSFFGEKITLEEALRIYKSRQRGMNQVLASAFWKSQHGNDWRDIVQKDAEMLVRIAEREISPYPNGLGSVYCPVLITASREDEDIPNIEERVKKLSTNLKKSKTMIFDKGKHPFMITQREKFRKIALDFFRE